MMEILLGTSNPSKVDYFARQLADYDVTFLTLRDLGITKLADEDGKNPMENAMAKAAFYGQFADFVISADSALYIRELPLEDPRQPGLFIRRHPEGGEMNDEEMIAHYSALARQLGGKMTCWYQDGYAVSNHGKVTGFMDTGPVNDVYSFYMVDTPHPNRVPGWPLDSISIRRKSGAYFVESREEHMTAAEEVLAKHFQQDLLAFYERALGLRRR